MLTELRPMLALAILTIGFITGAATPVGAQDTGDTAPTVESTIPAIKAPSALPKPNSGAEPQFQGDRGTATQYFVMGGIAAGLGVMFLLIRRESRRKLAKSDSQTDPSS